MSSRGELLGETGTTMVRTLRVVYLTFFLAFLCAGPAAAQKAEPLPPEAASVETAPVVIDGVRLFSVRGIRAFPASERAQMIQKRIRTVAADRTVALEAIGERSSDLSTDIAAGPALIMSVFDADGQLEGVQRQVLARIYLEKVRTAVEAYRRDRSAKKLLTSAVFAVLATAAFLAAVTLLFRLFRRMDAALERRYRARIEALRIQNVEIVQARRIWATITGALRTVRGVLVAVLVYFYLDLVLSLFPWTRALAAHLLDYVVTPLGSMAHSLLEFFPDLIVIILIVVLTRYALKVLELVFLSIERGSIVLSGFEPEWAKPTYKIVRLLVIVFAIVVIYPYVPGAESAAFKGISLFLGLVFSLGSSSAISNVIAGYSLTYRRAFHVGDRVKIGEITGDVTEMRMQVTHIRTVKNEEVTIPNSVILGTAVVNYSSLARDGGLILHTSVTIGYDTPWRQVQALLLLAAERTAGLRPDPRPFVLQTALNDFYINYELNAYTDRPREMAQIYSDLHKNIQDAFNEQGVQIMSPHYLGDPAQAKVVPKERWFEPPADQGAGEENT